MKRYILSAGILLIVFGLFFAFPATSHAQEELQEGMSQGDFALWLVKAIDAQTKLPPAATGEDAVAFLTKLGIIPEGGWQKDETITNELLTSLLDGEEGTGQSFDELVEKVREHVKNAFNQKTLGVFRAQSSGNPSAPA